MIDTPRPLHFCHVVTGLLGGPEVIVRQLLEMQLAAGHRTTLVFSTVHGGDDTVVRKLPEGVELIRWDATRDIHPAKDFAIYLKLVSILRGLQPDVVHLHNSKAGALGRIACRTLSLRNIYSPHGPAYFRRDINPLKRTAYFSLEWILSLLGGQVVASSASEREAISFLPCRKHFIPNGVDLADIDRRAGGAPVLSPSGKFRIVVCGRLWPQKNPEFVARLAAESPQEWEWLWVGDGPLRPAVEQGKRVKVLGWQEPDAVLATVRTADVYLQASRWEGMSFALLEAMALARPCVVSNVPGNRDLVREGVSGFVCESAQSHLQALKALEADPTLRARLGKGARATIAAEFSLGQITHKWSELYRSDASDVG